MYYPFLRGRQFELITIRELAVERAIQGVVTPIIEPVTEKKNNLDLAFKVLEEHQLQAYLVMNPQYGFEKGDTKVYLDYLNSLELKEVYLPAFIYNGNHRYISESISKYDLNNCMLICSNDIQVDSGFNKIAGLDQVSAIAVNDPGRNRTLARYIRSLGKSFIRIDDLFSKEVRNQDYLPIQERLFTEEHLHYSEENFQGFGDYTVLPNEFSTTGSTPRAVVIHLTYMKSDQTIWIRHFTSTTNDSIANVQGKFSEAAKKAVKFCETEGLDNSAINELISFFNQGHYPGLGTVKKLSMKNHILVVADYLCKTQN